MANELEPLGIQDEDLSPVLGSPGMPDRPIWRHLTYGCVMVLLGVTSSLIPGIFSTNLSYIGGQYGMYSDESSWLMILYLAGNATGNLLWIKIRQQFNSDYVSKVMLFLYVLIAIYRIIFQESFIIECILRFAEGLVTTSVSTLTVFYALQTFWGGPKGRLTALLIGICCTQLGSPVARIVSPSLFYNGLFQPSLYFMLGMAIACFVATLIVPLPSSQQRRVYESADFMAYTMFFVPAYILIAAFLMLGRTDWWDKHWLWVALSAGVLLFSAGMVIEFYRKTPIIVARFLVAPEILGFLAVGVSVRLLLAEQTVGVTGFLSTVGMSNDQLVTYGWVLFAGTVLGILVIPFVFKIDKPLFSVAVAMLMIGTCGFFDAHSNYLSRPENFYVTQFFVSMATIFFFGPLFVTGIMRMLLAGADSVFVTWVMLFSVSQNLGGLLASAIFGTFQTVRADFHTRVLLDQANAGRPEVASHLAKTAGALASTQTDASLRSASAVGSLSSSISTQANILAYNDVFLVTGALAFGMGLLAMARVLTMRLRNEKAPITIMGEKIEAVKTGPPPPPEPPVPRPLGYAGDRV